MAKFDELLKFRLGESKMTELCSIVEANTILSKENAAVNFNKLVNEASYAMSLVPEWDGVFTTEERSLLAMYLWQGAISKYSNINEDVRVDSWIEDFKSSSITKANRSFMNCLLYTSPSPRDRQKSRMPSSA